MTEKAPRPFKSGVTNTEELHKRIRELGIRSIFENEEKNKVGVDVTPPQEPVQNDPGHYGSYFYSLLGESIKEFPLWKLLGYSSDPGGFLSIVCVAGDDTSRAFKIVVSKAE